VKSKVALAVAIALAILAAVGIRAYLRQEVEKRTGEQKLVPVLAAAKNIRAGAQVFSDMVQEKMVDQLSVQDRQPILAYEARKIYSQRIQKAARAGQLLMWDHFKTPSKREAPDEGLLVGYRQITVPVDKVTGCAGRLLPGTTVDVLVTLRKRPRPNAPIEAVTQPALTGVKVAAVDLRTRRPYEFLSSKERREYAAYSTVTLEVLPGQAALLAFLADQGKMHLVIRSPDDPTGTDPANWQKISIENLDAVIRRAAEAKPEAVAAE